MKKFLILPFLLCGVLTPLVQVHSFEGELNEGLFKNFDEGTPQASIYFDYPPNIDAKSSNEAFEPVSDDKAQDDTFQEKQALESNELEKLKDAPLKSNKSAVTYSVALVVMPRRADGSAWDVGAGADLVLCGAAGCYVSNGLESAATFYEGSAGLRLIKKAGACRDSTACVFRDVDLSKLVTIDNATIQPVDVDYVSHSYMDDLFDKGMKSQTPLFKVENCSLKKSVLACKVGVHRRDYSLWLVPEKLADLGSKEALDAVLFKGLLHQRAKTLTDELLKHRVRVQTASLEFYKKMFAGDADVSLDQLNRCVLTPEFLSETFYVLGLADASERRAEALLTDMVGKLPPQKIHGLIQRTPQFFWAFLDLTSQLEAFAFADQYRLDKEQTGVLLKKIKTDISENEKKAENKPDARSSAESHELIYGWQVKARAKAALSHCELGTL
ncbi:MAG: hypothetical protein JJ964_14280 [Rhizobiales bacterium]|nr:hypothetical protein [Hyphomicrobiales bacterium]